MDIDLEVSLKEEMECWVGRRSAVGLRKAVLAALSMNRCTVPGKVWSGRGEEE